MVFVINFLVFSLSASYSERWRRAAVCGSPPLSNFSAAGWLCRFLHSGRSLRGAAVFCGPPRGGGFGPHRLRRKFATTAVVRLASQHWLRLAFHLSPFTFYLKKPPPDFFAEKTKKFLSGTLLYRFVGSGNPGDAAPATLGIVPGRRPQLTVLQIVIYPSRPPGYRGDETKRQFSSAKYMKKNRSVQCLRP